MCRRCNSKQGVTAVDTMVVLWQGLVVRRVREALKESELRSMT
jgi:hypothetical protein